jgi:hypothetical protein
VVFRHARIALYLCILCIVHNEKYGLRSLPRLSVYLQSPESRCELRCCESVDVPDGDVSYVPLSTMRDWLCRSQRVSPNDQSYRGKDESPRC